MSDCRSIRSVISRLIGVTLLGLNAASANAQNGLVTWTLKAVSGFESGESASGSFTLDPAPIAAGPRFSFTEGVVGWNIVVTGGTNPQIPTITFSSTDTGCVWNGWTYGTPGEPSSADCAGFSKSFLPSQYVVFRSPISPNNTFYEFAVGVIAQADDLIFPTFPRDQELALGSTPPPIVSHGDPITRITFAEYLPSSNTVRFLAESELLSFRARASIVTTPAVPEPAAVELLVAGIALIGSCLTIRRLAQGRQTRRRLPLAL